MHSRESNTAVDCIETMAQICLKRRDNARCRAVIQAMQYGNSDKGLSVTFHPRDESSNENKNWKE
jgi:hypothetical protein